MNKALVGSSLREIEEGTTIGSLLDEIAISNAHFHKVVFNPDLGKVSDQVIAILNDSLLQLPDVAEVKLNDGDSTLGKIYVLDRQS